MQQNWSVMIQALTSRILTLKINQGTKFGTLKKPIFSLFDVVIYLFIFWLNGIIKQTYRVWLPVSNIWNNRLLRIVTFPWITAFFFGVKKKRIIAPGYYLRKYSTSFQSLWSVVWKKTVIRGFFLYESIHIIFMLLLNQSFLLIRLSDVYTHFIKHTSE